MTDVPVGIGRLLSRTMQPALTVGRLAGLAAPHTTPEPFADAAPVTVAESPGRSRGAAQGAPRTAQRSVVAQPESGRAPHRGGVAAYEPYAAARPARPSPSAASDEQGQATAVASREPSVPEPAADATRQVPPAAEHHQVGGPPEVNDGSLAMLGVIEADAPASLPAAPSPRTPVAPAAVLEQPNVRRAIDQAATTAQGPRRGVATDKAASPPPPVVIGQIAVHVTNPEPPADPFAGCRALADGITATRGGGW